MSLLQRFLVFLGYAVTIFGGLILADEKSLELEFLLIVVASLALVFGKPLGKRLLDVGTAVRNYPKLLRRVGSLEAEVEELRRERAATQRDMSTVFIRGIEEGRAQARATVLSMRLPAMPVLQGFMEIDGEIQLLGTYEEQAAVVSGTRFFLQDSNTGEIKGALDVASIDPSTRRLYMRCVEPSVEAFWEHLRATAALGSALPDELVLAPYTARESDQSAAVRYTLGDLS